MFIFLFLSLFYSYTCLACQYHSWDPRKIHIAALILARGGSKGIPLKNLAKIQQQPLLNITLNTVRQINFDSVWVSTDSEKIFESFKEFNIHWRAAETATDTAPSILGVQEFLHQHLAVDYVALIQCTSPLLRADFLRQALLLLQKNRDCVFSVSRSFKLRWQEYEKGLEPLNFNPKRRPRRQDWAGELVENGMFYFASRKLVLNGLLQNESEPIHRDVYQSLLNQSKLDTSKLKIIWDMAGPPQGLISRTNLYKTLALIAWAQQGRTLSEKLFDNASSKEYPTPELGDLTIVKNTAVNLHLKENPAVLGLTYTEITQLDTISIELVPEKKGLFLKHSEYLVSSRRFNSKVTRRYNDFLALQELLINRFPYRMVPRLPPKKIVSDSHFLEIRRRGLHRWMTLVCRHPTISHDALVAHFLTDQGSDIQHRMRDIFRRAPDEFMTSDLAATAKNLLPSDHGEIATSREQIRSLVQIIGRLKYLTENSVERQNSYGRDSEDLAAQLKSLSALNIGGSWTNMQKGFSGISQNLHILTNKSKQNANIEQITVCERLGLLLDVLISHRDLCERLEKGLANDHQQALSKMLSLKKRKIQGVIRGSDTESVEQLEGKMLAQENIITNIELRSDFSLYCVHMETQLVYAYLETLSSILNSLISLRIKSHTELADIWKQLLPVVEQYLPAINGARLKNS